MTKRISIMFSDDAHVRMKELTHETGLSQANLVSTLLEQVTVEDAKRMTAAAREKLAEEKRLRQQLNKKLHTMSTTELQRLLAED